MEGWISQFIYAYQMLGLMADKSISYILFSCGASESECVSTRPSQVNLFPKSGRIRSTKVQVGECKQQELLFHMLHALTTLLMVISAHSLITHSCMVHTLPYV